MTSDLGFDHIQVPDELTQNFISVTPAGVITFDFTGHVHAKGLDLDAAISGVPPADDRVRWLRVADGLVAVSISAYTIAAVKAAAFMQALDPDNSPNTAAQLNLYANDSGDGNRSRISVNAGTDIPSFKAGSALLIDSDGRSNFLQLVSAARLRYHGRIDIANFPPAAPIDGDCVDAVIDAGNGIVWRFLYNAGSASAFKWEFIGGPPISAEVDTLEATATTGAYVDLATVGPSVTIPRAGDYEFAFGCTMVDSANVTVQARATPKWGAAAAADADNIGFSHQAQGAAIENEASVARSRKHTGFATNDVVKLQYKTTVANQPSFMRRFIKCWPVRVS